MAASIDNPPDGSGADAQYTFVSVPVYPCSCSGCQVNLRVSAQEPLTLVPVSWIRCQVQTLEDMH